MKVQERFLRYISVDTTSDPSSTTFPSTKSQLNFADSLVREMKEMGLKDVSCDENGYVFGTIPATIENYQGPVLGFIAHNQYPEAQALPSHKALPEAGDSESPA